ncbi:MAG: GNAT family N-acetyltransferase [Gemmatimonadota bacterium]
MSLIIRDGRTDDVEPAARMAAHAFAWVGYSAAAWQQALISSPHGGIETLRIGEEGRRAVAMCRLYDFQQWIGGEALPIMGLGMVAVSPAARRRGLAGRMVEDALRQGRDRGALASALFPFRTSFYSRLGYGVAGEALEYRVPPAALPDDPDRVRVRLADSEADRSEIASVYDLWARAQAGQLQRSARTWDLVWRGERRHGVLYRDEAGRPAGYAVFDYPDPEAYRRPAIAIDEIAWLSREARMALYGWLASLRDQVDLIVYRAHPDEGFGEHLVEQRFPAEPQPGWHLWFPAATLLLGPMFRLLDVERAWQARSVDARTGGVLSLRVEDSQLPENAGEWTLRFDSGQVDIIRGTDDSADLHLHLGIGTLSQIFIGALTPSEALARGLATSTRSERLDSFDSLLRIPRPWTFDRF